MQEYKYLTPWHEYCEDLVRSRMDWDEGVPCKVQGPHRMYPTSEEGQKIIAQDVCRGCRAQTECLNLALVMKEDYGVWGGATEKDRREIRKELSKKTDLSNKNVWKKTDVRLAVLEAAEAFVEAQGTEYKTATVG